MQSIRSVSEMNNEEVKERYHQLSGAEESLGLMFEWIRDGGAAGFAWELSGSSSEELVTGPPKSAHAILRPAILLGPMKRGSMFRHPDVLILEDLPELPKKTRHYKRGLRRI